MFESFESETYEKQKPFEVRATEALGLGFDLASDFRIKFVKRSPYGGRLVILDQEKKRDVVVPGLGGGVKIADVPECIRVDKGDHIRFKSDVLQFNQMLKKCSRKAVPSRWDPAALSRFIQTYGAHIVVEVAVGGQDLLCVKQTPSSTIPPAELKGYLEELGDCLFSDSNS